MTIKPGGLMALGMYNAPLPAKAGVEEMIKESKLLFDGTAKQDVDNHLPTNAEVRKGLPIMAGVLDYFPLALAYVGKVSKYGNDQHNPGEPMHWARDKSTDHANTIVRHLIERGTVDVDKIRHSGKAAWRALALLQTELEAAIKNGEEVF